MSGKDLTGYYYTKLIKSLRYLEYSYQRVRNLSPDPAQLSAEDFEKWDGFAVRFARSSDIFLSKFIGAAVRRDDPAFDGGFRDKLDQAEKLGIIENVPIWMEIRQLRNVTVHEYSDQDLKEIFKKLIHYAPKIMELEKHLTRFVGPL